MSRLNLMEAVMLDVSKMESLMEMENKFRLMAVLMMEAGNRASDLDRVLKLNQQAKNSKVFGKMINLLVNKTHLNHHLNNQKYEKVN